MSSGCVFCAIVAGEQPAEVVYRDDVAVAFLDRTPLFPGHVLVVPTEHVVTLPELADVGPFFERVQLRRRRRARGRAARRARSSPTTTSSARASPTCTCTSCRGPRATGCAASSGRGREYGPGEAAARRASASARHVAALR